MRTTVILCALSAAIGATLALVLNDPPQAEPITAAGELPGRVAPGPSAAAAQSAEVDLRAVRPLPRRELSADEKTNIAVYQSGNRGVVHINTRSVYTDRFFLLERTAKGEGSGIVIDRQGHVLTNYHVVVGARDVNITLYNGKTFDARMVGRDAATDVAVLKIDAPDDCLFPVTFGSSTGLQVGQRVFAIGNPFGLERTLSTGIISSLNRSLPRRDRRGSLKSIIQIDAAINPGNSGGPLLDTRGRMIGMNTAIASKTGESAGVGFAIPVNTISRVVPELIRNGRVLRGDIGIDAVYRTERGLLIAALVPGGAAEKAGLQGPKIIRRRKRHGIVIHEYTTVDRAAADLIVGIDGKPVKRTDDFLDVIESKRPDDEVTVNIVRDGEAKAVVVRLEAER